jgi:hypothetical protein
MERRGPVRPGSAEVFAREQVAVEEPGRLLLVARNEMAVAVERDLDGGVAEWVLWFSRICTAFAGRRSKARQPSR